MKNLHVFLMILLLIIIIITSMMQYKIETFSNLIDPNVFPQTPNNETCYNYIKNVKKWNIDELTQEQQKVLFTMRALLGSQYSDDSKVFPFKNGCVIPYEHLPIFDADENIQSLTLSPPNKPSITLTATDTTMNPQGLYINFSDPNNNYDKFKDLLNEAYLRYDKDFLTERKQSDNEINALIKIRDNLKKELNDLVNQTNNYNSLINDPNTECQKLIQNNNNVLIPKWNNSVNGSNYYVNRYNILAGYVQDGKNQINILKNIYQDAQNGRWKFTEGGSVNNIN
jgi:hypothetical protein